MGHQIIVQSQQKKRSEISGIARLDRARQYSIFEFDNPVVGLAASINRSNPGFIGRGLTRGGAREFVIPNVRIDEFQNVSRRTLP
jgi:hypothetical protein